jgi:hypothetical protein
MGAKMRIRFFAGILIGLTVTAGMLPAHADVPPTPAETQSGGKEWQAWTIPANISQSPATKPQSIWPTLDMDPNGHLIYVAWSDCREGGCGEPDSTAFLDVYYTLSINGGDSWASAQPIASTEANSLRPSLKVANDTIAVVWAEEAGDLSGLTHVTYQWTLETREMVEVPNNHSWLASAPDLAAESDGTLHLALQGGLATQPDVLYTRRDSGAASWLAAGVVFNHTASGSFNPAIAVSSDGQFVHLVWQEVGQVDESTIYYRRGKRSGNAVDWSAPVSLSPGIARSVRPAIVVGAGQTIHVAWGEQTSGYETQYVRYARSTDAGLNWSSPVRIDRAPVAANAIAPTDVAPSLAVGPDTEVCTAWHGFRLDATVEAEEIYVACSTDGGTHWMAPVNVSQSPLTVSIRPVLGLAGNGVLHVAWQELVGQSAKSDYQIFYSKSMPYSAMLPLIRR